MPIVYRRDRQWRHPSHLLARHRYPPLACSKRAVVVVVMMFLLSRVGEVAEMLPIEIAHGSLGKPRQLEQHLETRERSVDFEIRCPHKKLILSTATQISLSVESSLANGEYA